jgi:hypothetical protein
MQMATNGTPADKARILSNDVTQASHTRHYTLKRLHSTKNNKYKQRCHEIDSSFMPLAFESFGAVSEQT